MSLPPLKTGQIWQTDDQGYWVVVGIIEATKAGIWYFDPNEGCSYRGRGLDEYVRHCSPIARSNRYVVDSGGPHLTNLLWDPDGTE